MTPDDLLRRYNDSRVSRGLEPNGDDLAIWSHLNPSYSDLWPNAPDDLREKIRETIISAKLYCEARDHGMTAALILRLQLES